MSGQWWRWVDGGGRGGVYSGGGSAKKIYTEREKQNVPIQIRSNKRREWVSVSVVVLVEALTDEQGTR